MLSARAIPDLKRDVVSPIRCYFASLLGHWTNKNRLKSLYNQLGFCWTCSERTGTTPWRSYRSGHHTPGGAREVHRGLNPDCAGSSRAGKSENWELIDMDMDIISRDTRQNTLVGVWGGIADIFLEWPFETWRKWKSTLSRLKTPELLGQTVDQKTQRKNLLVWVYHIRP